MISLNLNWCHRITDIEEGCKNLLELQIAGCFGVEITNTSIFRLAAVCPLLQGFNFARNHEISRISILEIVAKCPDFKNLILHENETITDTDMISIAESGNNLQNVDLLYCPHLGSKEMYQLKRITHI